MPEPRRDGGGPAFSAGTNIAVKVPAHRYEATVAFYRDVLGFAVIAEELPQICFAFGPCRLWIDPVDVLSQAEIWLEVRAGDLDAAAHLFADKGVARRDAIEPLPEGFAGFWIAGPADVIHLVRAADRSETA